MLRESRRRFCRLLAVGAASAAVASIRAQRGLDQFLLPAPPCKDDVTPPLPPGREYRPNAPVKRSLAEPDAPGVAVALSGYVTGLSCGRLKDTRVEFWQADPAGQYDMKGYRFRGAVVTDQEGRYSILTVEPGHAPGQARRIHARVMPRGKKDLSTALYFPNDDGAKADKDFKPALVLKPVSGMSHSYRFDFLLDV